MIFKMSVSAKNADNRQSKVVSSWREQNYSKRSTIIRCTRRDRETIEFACHRLDKRHVKGWNGEGRIRQLKSNCFFFVLFFSFIYIVFSPGFCWSSPLRSVISTSQRHILTFHQFFFPFQSLTIPNQFPQWKSV